MKKLTLLIGMALIIGTLGVQAQETIPNNGFEAWNSSTDPKDWQTVNDLLPMGFIACYQTSNSYEDSSALFMKTIDLDGMLVPAVASLGTVGMGFTEGGIPYTAKPESLKGYFKHQSSGDPVSLFVQFFNQGTEIGSGSWTTSDSIADFTMFEAPITFSSALNPDTMNITIITDQFTLGSSITIDALQFEFAPVVVNEVEYNSIQVYPNPCYDYISIKTDKNINSLEVINLSGEKILLEEIKGTTKKIDLRNLPKGLYVLKIDSENNSFTRKIIKK